VRPKRAGAIDWKKIRRREYKRRISFGVQDRGKKMGREKGDQVETRVEGESCDVRTGGN